MITPYYKNDHVTLYNGDCMEIMPQLEQTFDCCITDPPYGTTHNQWDSLIPFECIWKNINRLTKENAAICLFGQGLFSAKCMISNEKEFRYNLIWKKGERTSGFLNANRMPLRNHEDIMVFYKSLPTYHPQMEEGERLHGKGHSYKIKKNINNNYGEYEAIDDTRAGSTSKFPKSVLIFDRPHPPVHPTQKPTELIEYLINTYTDKDETVLDFTSGSGTTGVACMQTGRKCVMIEKEEKYCEITVKRLMTMEDELSQRLFIW